MHPFFFFFFFFFSSVIGAFGTEQSSHLDAGMEAWMFVHVVGLDIHWCIARHQVRPLRLGQPTNPVSQLLSDFIVLWWTRMAVVLVSFLSNNGNKNDDDAGMYLRDRTPPYFNLPLR